MKVKQLIKQLKKLDPEMRVFAAGDHGWIYNCPRPAEYWVVDEDGRDYTFEIYADEDMTDDPDDDYDKMYKGNAIHGVVIWP